MTDVLVHSIGWALVQFVWQGAVIAGVTAAGFVVCRHHAAVRYAIGVGGLSAMLVAVASTAAWDARPGFQPAGSGVADRGPATRLRGTSSEPAAVRGPDVIASSVPSESDHSTGPTPVSRASGLTRASTYRARIEPWLPSAVWAWLAGVLAFSLNLLRGWLHVRRIRRTAAHAVSAGWTSRVAALSTRLRLTRPVRVCESALVDVPAVIGWLRPVLLLPVSALSGLSPAQLDAVIAHELAHVRRHDYLVNMLQSGVETLLFFHPAVWWISHRIRVDREHCCDDVAVQVCGDRLIYAHALVNLEEARLARHSFVLAVTDGPLLTRIRRVLGVTRRDERSPGWILGVVALILIAMATTGRTARSAPEERPALTADALRAAAPRSDLQDGPRVGLTHTPGVAQPSPAPAPQPASTAGSSIRGRLTAAATRTPLRGARVVVAPSPSVPSLVQYLYTDNDGRYEANGLAPGRYTVRASKEGFVELAYGESQPLQGGKTLQVGDKETIGDVNFRLPRGGVITGRVTDAFGDPVVRAGVSAREVTYGDGQVILPPVSGLKGWTLLPIARSATASDHGEFRIYGLKPGSYYISATKNVTPDAIYTQTYAPGTTDLSQARRIVVEAGGTVSGVTVALGGIIRPATVSGTVISPPDRPITGGRVMVYQAGAPPVGGSNNLTASGSFTILGMRPGTYELRALVPGAAAVGTVTVDGKDVTDAVLRPIRMPTLTGRVVVDPQSARQLAGAPVRIGALSMDPNNSPGWTPAAVALDQDMGFTMNGLPGRWLINATLPAGWTIKAIRARGVDVADSGIEFHEGDDVRDVEIEVTTRVQQITGSVRGARNEAITDYTVLVFARDAARRSRGGRYFAMARPDDTGRFTVTTLAPGDYYAIALPYVNVNEAQSPDLLERLERDGTAVSLRDGEARTLDLRIVR